MKKEDADIDLALEMLTLAHAWSMSDAQNALQNTVISMKMVDPYNLDHGKPSVVGGTSNLRTFYYAPSAYDCSTHAVDGPDSPLQRI